MPIKNILLYLRDVDTLDTNSINCQIRYDRNNQIIGYIGISVLYYGNKEKSSNNY